MMSKLLRKLVFIRVIRSLNFLIKFIFNFFKCFKVCNFVFIICLLI